VECRNQFILDDDNAGRRVHHATFLGEGARQRVLNIERDASWLAPGQFLCLQGLELDFSNVLRICRTMVH
jgi:hypothetical protein